MSKQREPRYWAMLDPGGNTPPLVVYAGTDLVRKVWLQEEIGGFPTGRRVALKPDAPLVRAAYLKGEFSRVNCLNMKLERPSEEDLREVLDAHLKDFDKRLKAEARRHAERKEAIVAELADRGWAIEVVSASMVARVHEGHRHPRKPTLLAPLTVRCTDVQDPRTDEPAYPSATFGTPGAVPTLLHYMQARSFAMYISILLDEKEAGKDA